jgi:hypothetical protein
MKITAKFVSPATYIIEVDGTPVAKVTVEKGKDAEVTDINESVRLTAKELAEIGMAVQVAIDDLTELANQPEETE